jgi:hypothetical protein
MEGSKKPLVISRVLRLIVFIGVVGLAASPFTCNYLPNYPYYFTFEYSEEIVLNDAYPVEEIPYTMIAEEVVLEELTTNGSAVVISIYNPSSENESYVLIENVTEIKNSILVLSQVPYAPDFGFLPPTRLSRQNSSHSIQVMYTIRGWLRAYPDIIAHGPSVFLLLAAPLFIAILWYRGRRPTKRGYGILFVVIISAVLTAPMLVYSYNGYGATVRTEEDSPIRDYNITLDLSNPTQDIIVSVNTSDTGYSTRIADFATNSTTVSLSVHKEGDDGLLELNSITTNSTDVIHFVFPNNTISTYTVCLSRIDQNVTVSLSVQEVQVSYHVWIDPVPYYVTATSGLAIFLISVIIPPHRQEGQRPNESDFDQLVR